MRLRATFSCLVQEPVLEFSREEADGRDGRAAGGEEEGGGGEGRHQ